MEAALDLASLDLLPTLLQAEKKKMATKPKQCNSGFVLDAGHCGLNQWLQPEALL